MYRVPSSTRRGAPFAPAVLDPAAFRANRFAAAHTGQFMAAAALPQQVVVLLSCFLDLSRELARQMLRNRRVVDARPQVRAAGTRRPERAANRPRIQRKNR